MHRLLTYCLGAGYIGLGILRTNPDGSYVALSPLDFTYNHPCDLTRWSEITVSVSSGPTTTVVDCYIDGVRTDGVTQLHYHVRGVDIGTGRITTGRGLAFSSYSGNVAPDVSLMIDDLVVTAPHSASQAKSEPDNAPVSLRNGVVTASFPGFLYVESHDRTSGIRVVSPVHQVSLGRLVDVSRSMATTADGERCIEAAWVGQNGAGRVMPLAVTNRSIGGGPRQYDPSTGAAGLNNIGLLVRTGGRVESAGSGYFVIDDGSGVSLKCVVPAGTSIPGVGSYVSVTGISSCEKVGAEVRRLLRVCAQRIGPTY